MVSIDDFIKYKYLEYGKVFLVLYFKGFSWKKELQNEFNISSSIVSKAINILEESGYIIAKDFWSLDIDVQECIRRLNGAYSYLLKSHPKIYTLSIEGKEYGDMFIDDFKEKAKVHSSLRASIEYISQKTQAYKLLLKKFEEIENTQYVRNRIDHETGILYQTDTKKTIEFYKQLKYAQHELENHKNQFQKKIGNKSKKNKKKDENKYKNEIALKQSNNILQLANLEMRKNLNKKTNLYNGKILNSIEIAELEKTIKKERKEKNKKLNNEPIGLNEDEVDRAKIRRINYIKNILDIGSSSKNKKEREKEVKICTNIIENIKKKGWMDILNVQRRCGSHDVFGVFLSLANKENIKSNGEEFIYEK